jgi:hypothetical protein
MILLLLVLGFICWWLYVREPKEPPPNGILFYAGHGDPWKAKHKYPGWVLVDVEETNDLYDDDCGLTVFYKKLTYKKCQESERDVKS